MITAKGLERHAPAIPIVLLLVVVWTAFILFVIVQDHLQTAIDRHGGDKTSAMTYQACLFWTVSFTAFVLMATWLMLVSIYPIVKYMNGRDQRSALAGSLVILFGIIKWHQLPRFSGGRSLLDPLEPVLRSSIVTVSAVGYAIGSISVWLMIFACVALASKPDSLSASDLRQRFDLAKLMLFSSAALLAVSVAQVYFLYDWAWRAQTVVLPHTNSAHEMARSTAIAYAIVYTAFLVAAHLPLSVIQEFQIRAVIAPHEDTTAQPDLRQWKIRNGLDRSPLFMLVEMFAMAGPILTAIGLPKLFLGA
jgi:hypothetical protein